MNLQGWQVFAKIIKEVINRKTNHRGSIACPLYRLQKLGSGILKVQKCVLFQRSHQQQFHNTVYTERGRAQLAHELYEELIYIFQAAKILTQLSKD